MEAVNEIGRALRGLAETAGKAIGAAAAAMAAPLIALAAALDEALGNKLRDAVAGVKNEIEEGLKVIGEFVNLDSAARRTRIEDEQKKRHEAEGAELDQLTALAKWKAEFASMPWLTDDGEDGAAPGRPPNLRARLGDAVKGITGSSAAIGQQLAYGDTIPMRQLDAQEATRDVLTQNLPQLARDVNALAGRGRVG